MNVLKLTELNVQLTLNVNQINVVHMKLMDLKLAEDVSLHYLEDLRHQNIFINQQN